MILIMYADDGGQFIHSVVSASLMPNQATGRQLGSENAFGCHSVEPDNSGRRLVRAEVYTSDMKLIAAKEYRVVQ